MQKINCQTAYRRDLRDRILSVSMDEFQAHGVRAVKMDDIACKLSISKRTLYEIYANKEELLLEGIEHYESAMNRHMEEFAADASHNVIDILLEFFHMKIEHTAGMNPLFIDELSKYPKVLAFFDQQHAKLRQNQRAFLKRGVCEGYFRSDIDYDIVTRIGDAAMEYVMRTQMYRTYKLNYLYHNVTLLFLRGICTEKGVRLLDKSLL